MSSLRYVLVRWTSIVFSVRNSACAISRFVIPPAAIRATRVSLAAEGQTNREIAQALFLTVKTVETHLSNAYRKLDIRSRQDLAGAL